MNVFVSWEKEEMELLGKLVYHVRLVPYVGPKTLAHASFTKLSWDGGCEHPLLVECNMIGRICSAIIKLHVRKGKIPWHLYRGNGVYDWSRHSYMVNSS